MYVLEERCREGWDERSLLELAPMKLRALLRPRHPKDGGLSIPSWH